MLGLEPDFPSGKLHLRPRLPAGTRRLEIVGVPFGGGTIDIVAAGDDVTVSGLPDDIVLHVDAS